MGIVLGEAADARHAVQLARLFESVHRAELRQPQRQIAVTFQSLIVDLNMTGAVHRLDRVQPLFRLGDEHVGMELLPVAGFFPQGAVHQLRRADFAVAVLAPQRAHVLDDGLVQTPAALVPEHHARGFFLHVKQIETASDLAMVALLGFLDLVQVGVERLLAGPGGAVDARQHFVARIAAPVGAGDFHQFEGLELAGRGHMRPAAQVNKFTLAV